MDKKTWREPLGSGNPEAHDYAAAVAESVNVRRELVAPATKKNSVFYDVDHDDGCIPGGPDTLFHHPH